jgi:hypothetical protein
LRNQHINQSNGNFGTLLPPSLRYWIKKEFLLDLPVSFWLKGKAGFPENPGRELETRL